MDWERFETMKMIEVEDENTEIAQKEEGKEGAGQGAAGEAENAAPNEKKKSHMEPSGDDTGSIAWR